ncbi:MAG: hypothetical protein KKF67_03060, partial [Nanoarchaeota archaeon]|nr:hypothetical protein [Nanoarchaeota archaeon]
DVLTGKGINIEVAEDCEFMKDEIIISGENKKDMLMYSEKEVFLISDKNWKDVLPLVPVTTWAQQEEDDSECQRGYGTPEDVCVYPTLIYHEEENTFDADSIIYFMQQYNTEKVKIIGETPQELDNLLIAEPELGAGLKGENIKRISTEDYFFYWDSYKDVVYVEDDYGLALLASTYASLINAPLIIQGTELDKEDYVTGRNVICVNKTALNIECDESYNLEELQQKYVDKTNTDKIILVNPNDLNIKVEEKFTPEKSGKLINEIYSKTSLAAPILASAKWEVIISTTATDYQEVDSFIEGKIRELHLSPEYLTIVASPNAIDMTYTTPTKDIYSADAWNYSKISNNNPYLDLAVGRIFGLTVSDTSTNIARSIFYDKTLKNEGSLLIGTGYVFVSSPAEVYAKGKMFESIGYDAVYRPGGVYVPYGLTYPVPDEYKMTPDDFKNKFFIYYIDHGGQDWLGISSYQIPYLDNSLIITMACLTCSYNHQQITYNSYYDNSDLFCANAIRKGAVGYIGATDESGYFNFDGIITEIFARGSTVGKAFINTKNSMISNNNLRNENVGPWYSLMGDPTIRIKVMHKIPEPKMELISEQNGERIYKLSLSAIKSDIPENVKQLCQGGECPFEYYNTASGEKLISFIYRFNTTDLFEPTSITYGSENWRIIAKERTQNGYNIWFTTHVRFLYAGYDSGYFPGVINNQFTTNEYTLKVK